MEFASESRDPAIVEDLMNFFLSNNNKECFVATLYSCYDLLRPDMVMELAWRYKLVDYIMPYLIQVMRDYTNKVCLNSFNFNHLFLG
jgi:clathrin heavy chain